MQFRRVTVDLPSKKDPVPAIEIVVGEVTEVLTLQEFADAVATMSERGQLGEVSLSDLQADAMHFLARPR